MGIWERGHAPVSRPAEAILTAGVEKLNRTGIGTRSVFGHQMRFDLADGFPLMTTKKLPFKSIAYELLWFLAGNVKYLNDPDVTIRDKWRTKPPASSALPRRWRSNEDFRWATNYPSYPSDKELTVILTESLSAPND